MTSADPINRVNKRNENDRRDKNRDNQATPTARMPQSNPMTAFPLAGSQLMSRIAGNQSNHRTKIAAAGGWGRRRPERTRRIDRAPRVI
jgi:hypothetical protein